MIEIRNDTVVYYVHLERIHEWASGSWQKLMYHMVKGGEVNEKAVQILSEWFPRAIQLAEKSYQSSQRGYTAMFRSYRETPRADWEAQKQLNQALAEEVRSDRRRLKSLELKYKNFLAAKASMKKEN